MNRLGLIIASLFILALVLYLPGFLEEPPVQVLDEDARALTPTYQARNLTTTIYDEQGNRIQQVFSSHMEHYLQIYEQKFLNQHRLKQQYIHHV